ncbi:23758_t:CDS:1, partial [Dentiscutata erythropus]
SNKFCGAIVDKRTVFCICGQKIILDNNYNESRLNKHSKNSRYKVNNKKRQLDLPGLFPVLPKPSKKKENSSSLSPPPILSSLSLYQNKPCFGLYSEQISSYINRTLFTYRGIR